MTVLQGTPGPQTIIGGAKPDSGQDGDGNGAAGDQHWRRSTATRRAAAVAADIDHLPVNDLYADADRALYAAKSRS